MEFLRTNTLQKGYIMTFGEFIKTLNNSKVFGCNRDEIAVQLLKAAGIVIKDPKNHDSYEMITKWIDRKPPDKIIRYFPNGKFDSIGVINFFKHWANDKWEVLRLAFSQITDDCVINCVTNDKDEFFRSLLLQFIKSINLPLPEEAIFDDKNDFKNLNLMLNKNHQNKTKVNIPEVLSNEQNELQDIELKMDLKDSHGNETDLSLNKFNKNDFEESNQILMSFKQVIEEYSIANLLNNLLENNGDDFRKFSCKIDNFIEKIKSDIMCKFIGSQKLEIYKKIFEFINSLNDYNNALMLVTADISEYINLFHYVKTSDEIINMINNKIDKLNNEKCMIEQQECFHNQGKKSKEEPFYIELDNRKRQVNKNIFHLSFMSSVFINLQRIDRLYGEICDGDILFI